jgi:hypothetical protein
MLIHHGEASVIQTAQLLGDVEVPQQRVLGQLGGVAVLVACQRNSTVDKIGDRQRDMAKKFYQAGLLSRKGLESVLR